MTFDFANDIENMQLEAEILTSVALAAYEVIINGGIDYKEFDGQLYTVFNLASDHSKNLKALKEKAFEDLRKEREGSVQC